MDRLKRMNYQKKPLYPYIVGLTTGNVRKGVFIGQGDKWAEIAPLPGFSKESLEEAILDLEKGMFKSPSVSFALESLKLPFPAPKPISTSLLLLGGPDEILERANRFTQFKSAKLKVSQLSFDDARNIIDKLIDRFYLRIDVNRAWKTDEAITFFKRYPKDVFDYVEEPFHNPRDLVMFTHPLAVDESYPSELSLEDLEKLPTLKALIYKPTIQGGLVNARPLKQWADNKGIQFIASSAFETDLGLTHVLAFSQRIGLSEPVGIGTYHYLEKLFCDDAIQFLGANAIIKPPIPKMYDIL